jgi:hypothetical protein
MLRKIFLFYWLVFTLNIFCNTDQYIIYLGKDNWSNYITIVKCDSMVQVSAIDENVVLPDEIDFRCYPNPFNPIINFEVKLTAEYTEDTKIQIFNVKGQKIDELPLAISNQ